jgi:hypothetical protein
MEVYPDDYIPATVEEANHVNRLRARQLRHEEDLARQREEEEAKNPQNKCRPCKFTKPRLKKPKLEKAVSVDDSQKFIAPKEQRALWTQVFGKSEPQQTNLKFMLQSTSSTTH